MKRIYQLFCLLLLITSTIEVKAQALLKFSPYVPIIIPSPVNQGDTGSYLVCVKNYGNAQADSIEIVSGVMGSGFLNSIAVENNTNPFISGFVLQPGDSVTTLVTTYFSPNRFPVGIDVVVIWPRAAGAVTLDSSYQFAAVYPPFTGTAELNSKKEINLFPNPFATGFRISDALNLEKILIYDMNGKLLCTKPKANYYDFSNLPEASYFIDLIYHDGSRKRVKVLKQNDSK